MQKEVELKLSVSPGALRDAAALPWLRRLATGPIRRETISTVYFDTRKCKLRKNGISLRIRKIGRKRVQTIKADRAASASGRSEWEHEIDGRGPNLKLAKPTPLRALIGHKLKKSLRPLFETRVLRTTIPVRFGQSNIEVALDRGHLGARSSRASISEIELELKAGSRGDLVRLATRIGKAVPTAYGARSKAERGYALTAGRQDAVRATPLVLAPKAASAEAFEAIGLSCLHHLAANEDTVRHETSEGVHQMRVGLRRLRAAISVFKELVDGQETERIKTQLRWLTEELGRARDLDVFVHESVTPLRSAEPRKPELKLLEADVKAQRDAGFEQAKAAVEGERYRRVVLDTALWLVNGQWVHRNRPLDAKRRTRPIRAFARNEIRRRARKIIKTSRKIEHLDARRRHKLRIAVKKLRYATDFFASLFDRGKASERRRRFAKHLKTLQGSLGKLNDIAVHEKFARRYSRVSSRSKRPAQKAYAIGVLTGREQGIADDCVDAAIKSAKALAKAEPFWR